MAIAKKPWKLFYVSGLAPLLLWISWTAGENVVVLPRQTFEAKDTGRVVLSKAWGNGDDEIGLRCESGMEPQGAASFAVTSDGSIYILDQVNKRVQKCDATGKYAASLPLDRTTVDMIAVSDSHEVYVMDSILTGGIWKIAGQGKEQGKALEKLDVAKNGGLKFVSDLRIEDGELVAESAMERKCYPLTAKGLKISTTESKSQARSGRKSNSENGTRLSVRKVNADTISLWKDEATEQAVTIQTGRPILAIHALEADTKGRTYLGLLHYEPGLAPDYKPLNACLSVACLDTNNKVIGQVDMPECTYTEARRSLFITQDGTIYQLQTDAKGVRVVVWNINTQEGN